LGNRQLRVIIKYAAEVQKHIAILIYGNQLDELIATEESCDDSNKFNIRNDTYLCRCEKFPKEKIGFLNSDGR